MIKIKFFFAFNLYIFIILNYKLSGKGSITLNVTQTQFLAVLYLGIFSTGICFLLQTTCQQYTTPARASILLCTESLFAPVLSFLILHEVLTPKAIAGAALILISVIVSETKLGFGAKKEQST